MKIYISGISGTGMGPLALMAKAAGFTVTGSDLAKGDIYDDLVAAGIPVHIGPQDGEYLKQQLATGLDWFVYTSALPSDHAELSLARAAGIKVTKRDDFTAYLIAELGLKMVAVSGTHGKTTTTAMLIWAAKELALPTAYLVGTTLPWAPAGAYHPRDVYFIYEADEYDRNFLKFHPWLSLLPAVSYDHPDIYPTPADYLAAFDQFRSQSSQVLEFNQNHQITLAQSPTAQSQAVQSPQSPVASRSIIPISPSSFHLAGAVRREDAALACAAIHLMAPDIPPDQIIATLNRFPGAGRRFEHLSGGFYTDYAHHPDEITATLQVARDEAQLRGYSGITVVYQPHQNTRQHKIRHLYRDAFLAADHLYWLPTYLTREAPDLPILTPADFIKGLTNHTIAEPAALTDSLWHNLKSARAHNHLVLLLTAGPADHWLREKLRHLAARA